MVKTEIFTFKAKLRNERDQMALRELMRYCDRLGISLSTVVMNDDIVCAMYGRQDNLAEIEDYLEKVKADHA